MRLIGLGVLALLLFALIALLVDSRDEILTSVGIPIGPERHVTVLETASAPMPLKMSGTAGTAEFPIRQYDKWTALAGFSSNQSFSLPLPRQTDFSAAVLFLDIETDLEEDTTGRMRFVVNQKNRGEVVLNTGSESHQVQIPLEPIDMARDWVEVSMSIVGNNPKAECATDWTGGVVITVDPTSHVQVLLDEAITDLEDRLILSGSPSRIVWPETNVVAGSGPDVAWTWRPFVMESIFVAASEAQPNDVRASPEELSKYRDKKIAEHQLIHGLDGAQKLAWPVSLAKASVGLSREFRNRTSWVFDYGRADMPGRDLPDVLDLKLTAVSSDETISWLLLVTLNGQIIHSEQLSASEQLLDRRIALPTAIQTRQNQIKVTLTSDEDKEGRCVQGRPAAGQIKSGTSLNRIGAPSAPIYAGMLDFVSQKIDLDVSDALSAQAVNFGFYAMSNIFLSNTFHVGETAEGRSLAKLITRSEINTLRDQLGTSASRIWFAFAAITDEEEPQVFVFRADDPQMNTALEVFEPVSVLAIGQPGLEF